MSFALVILGPTASGKSALALDVARQIDSEIISLDSALIYKGMDIGSAKPTKDELAICPHHLIDIISPRDSYNAASFREDCIKFVDDINKRGRLAIIVGGTMLYYKALVDGLSPVPKSDDITRKKVLDIANEKGWPYIHEMLKDIDNESYQRLSCNDKQRLSRALEVYLMTGKAISSYFENKGNKCPFARLEFALMPKNDDREALRALIKERFLKMLDLGFIDEVQDLLDKKLIDKDLPSGRCVGYRQVIEYLEGSLSYAEMIFRAVVATAHLAKHQMTWLRGSLKEGNRVRLTIGDKDNLSIVLDTLKKYKESNNL